MEINGTNPLIVSKNVIKQLEDPLQSGQTPKNSGEPSDSGRFESSVQSSEISHLNALIQSTPDIREDKVEKARRELDNGTYNVKADKIAEKILQDNLLDEVF